jgi:hypothetical protein
MDGVTAATKAAIAALSKQPTRIYLSTKAVIAGLPVAETVVWYLYTTL